MRINVTRSWYGVPGFVSVGEYEVNDPTLLGQASYLVENDYAVWVTELVSAAGAEESATIEEHPEETIAGGESMPGVIEETKNSADAEKALSEMTKAELVEEADERGIQIGNPKNLTKDEIIALLEAGGEA